MKKKLPRQRVPLGLVVVFLQASKHKHGKILFRGTFEQLDHTFGIGWAAPSHAYFELYFARALNVEGSTQYLPSQISIIQKLM